MNGAYGVGPAAFARLFEMLEKAAWIGASALLVLVVLWLIRGRRRT